MVSGESARISPISWVLGWSVKVERKAMMAGSSFGSIGISICSSTGANDGCAAVSISILVLASISIVVASASESSVTLLISVSRMSCSWTVLGAATAAVDN